MSRSIIKYIYMDTERDSPKPADAPPEGYVPVKASSLKLGTVLPFDVFLDAGSGMELRICKGKEYSHAQRKTLAHAETAFILSEDEETYTRYCDLLRLGPGGRISYTQKEFERYNHDKEIHYPIARDMLAAGLAGAGRCGSS